MASKARAAARFRQVYMHMFTHISLFHISMYICVCRYICVSIYICTERHGFKSTSSSEVHIKCSLGCIHLCAYVCVCVSVHVSVCTNGKVILRRELTLQRTATHCDALQHTSTHCNTLRRTPGSASNDTQN